MKYLNRKIKGLTLNVCAVGLASVVFSAGLLAAEARVQGLQLLDRIGEHREALSVYIAPKPSAGDLARLRALAARFADQAGVKFSDEMKLGMDGNRTALFSEQDPSATFELDSVTGSFMFNAGIAKYREEGDTKNLPQEADIEVFAQRALESYGLRIDPKQSRLAHVGGLNMGVTTGVGDSTLYEKLKTVRYGRVIDGLKVEGDSRVVVHLGESGELAGVVYQWPELKASTLDRSQLQKPAAIRQRALRQIYAVVGKSERSELTSADLVLYDDGKGVVEPAYHFVVERFFDYGESKERTMIPFDFYIPATVEPLAFYPHMEQAPIVPEEG